MKTLISKFWKHILCVLFFFVGIWVFNHLSAWFGIFISVVALIYFGQFLYEFVAKQLKE